MRLKPREPEAYFNDKVMKEGPVRRQGYLCGAVGLWDREHTRSIFPSLEGGVVFVYEVNKTLLKVRWKRVSLGWKRRNRGQSDPGFVGETEDKVRRCVDPRGRELRGVSSVARPRGSRSFGSRLRRLQLEGARRRLGRRRVPGGAPELGGVSSLAGSPLPLWGHAAPSSRT